MKRASVMATTAGWPRWGWRLAPWAWALRPRERRPTCQAFPRMSRRFSTPLRELSPPGRSRADVAHHLQGRPALGVLY